jgi:hypothetical protein
MSDLPLQNMLQQMNSHAHSGEYLEVLGKRAAARWSEGDFKTLTDAVTSTVKQAQLSPEQVRRVVEFANTSAYLDEFRKEGAPHHVVDFPGGPADPSAILQDLNDGGGGSVYDRGTGDYDAPPPEAKVSSSKAEQELFELLDKTAEADLPFENPHSEVMDLKDKLAGAAEHLRSEISGLEILYSDLSDRVYHQVKQAALSGVTLGEVMQAWESVAPSEDHVKVAFSLVTPRLLQDGVFYNVEHMTSSVDKTASAKVVNPAHPLVVEFGDFCDTLSKLAEAREVRAELMEQAGHLQEYLKTAASPSLAGRAYRGVTRLSSRAGEATGPLVAKALGEGAGSVAKGLITHAPNIALGLAGLEGYRYLKHSPSLPARAIRGAGNLFLRNVPGTQQNLEADYMAANPQMGGEYGY